MTLAGKRALITGSTSGIGLAIARALHAEGAEVILNGFGDSAEIDALCGELGALYSPANLLDVAEIEAMMARFGPVDILVNNAGIPDAQRAHKMPLDLVDRVLDVNLRAPWILACEVARRLIAAGKPGNIVNIASVAHYSYNGGGAALYAVTKTALVRMTEALAVEWAYAGINVNAIAPGMFVTEMTDGMFARIGDPTELVARRRVPVPAQMDSTLLYLVSPASECVTGATIRVDDGQSAQMGLRKG